MSVVTRKLIAKELYVNRWFIGGGSVTAAASVALAAAGGGAFNIGALTWLTTVIAFGVMLGIYGVVNERKEQSLQFVLSLPISIADYVRAKLFGLLLAFLIMWVAATASAVLVVLLAAKVPDGLLPYVLLLCFFMLANFCVVLCGALHARSEALVTGTIIVTNMGVSVFMFTVGLFPSLREHMFGATPVWNTTFFNVLIVELIVLVIAVVLPLVTVSRRRDFL
ncbi:MAG TPA: ABC-2 transporter permease [Steroidobacteraceae bacterium]|nr:ABC-2 transporter permease [Steroidobacteraceae bacterium]